MTVSKLTIIRVKQPNLESVNEKLLFIGGSLGLFNTRDKDKSCFRIFVKLLSSKDMTSDELAEALNLSRGTVIHHLHKLADSGLVIRKYNRYQLAFNNLEEVVARVKKEVDDSLLCLKKIAREIDKNLSRL